MNIITKNKGIIINLLLMAAIIAVIIIFFEQVSSFAVMLLLIDIAITKLYLVDKFVLKGYDTIEELQKGNVAVGLALLAYAIVVGAALVAAFLVWV
jgi:ABC-type uncharacterized transport system permease subunit